MLALEQVLKVAWAIPFMWRHTKRHHAVLNQYMLRGIEAKRSTRRTVGNCRKVEGSAATCRLSFSSLLRWSERLLYPSNAAMKTRSSSLSHRRRNARAVAVSKTRKRATKRNGPDLYSDGWLGMQTWFCRLTLPPKLRIGPKSAAPLFRSSA